MGIILIGVQKNLVIQHKNILAVQIQMVTVGGMLPMISQITPNNGMTETMMVMVIIRHLRIILMIVPKNMGLLG